MGLQRINWTQIDSSNVPSGYTVDIASLVRAINSIYSNNIYLSGISITDLYLNSGKFENNELILTSNSGNTITIPLTGFTTVDTYVTGATYENNTFTFTNNLGGTFSVSFDTLTGLTVNGDLIVDGNSTFSSGLTANTIYATTYLNLPVGNFTGGTVIGDTVFLSGLTANTIYATTYQNLPTDIRVTGATYNNNTFTFTNNTGGTFDVSFNTVSGLTINGNLSVTGNTTVQGLTGDTIYATTYLNLPVSNFTGGTVVGDTIFLSGVTANTIYATTYQNLPTDIRVTGATYNNNTFIFTNNTGGTFDVSFNTVSGLTVNGDLLVTGNTVIQSGLTANTIYATIYQNLPVTANTFTTGSTFNILTGTITYSRNDGDNYFTTGLTKFFISGSLPTGVTINNGDRWYNTNNGIELVYINDGDSSQWVQPSNTPGPPGYSNLIITSGITTSAAALNINTNYYGVNYNGQVNLTLPNPSGYDGYNMTIKDEGGYAGTYRIRLTPSSGLIDGNNYVDMNLNYIALHIVARNNNWWII